MKAGLEVEKYSVTGKGGDKRGFGDCGGCAGMNAGGEGCVTVCSLSVIGNAYGRRLAPGQTSLSSFGVLMKAVRPDFQFSFA